ncbi:hypothetical protein [Ensifer sp. SSB1]|jgi:hypothetical protein|uniref:hypothetical protein n=1 Tax=Ensifer sp. SSB1 TaxID=2795385 RepID=UPI001A6316AE|nr:hypothetical protein [Ensifer sp. SSB1]MBK5567239.1 hypothetical protein [Ensifer sp. SSB1]
MNIQLPLPVGTPAPEISTDEVRKVLLELARLHRQKARHYAAAAKDMAQAIQVDV